MLSDVCRGTAAVLPSDHSGDDRGGAILLHSLSSMLMVCVFTNS